MEWAAGSLLRRDWPADNEELHQKAKARLQGDHLALGAPALTILLVEAAAFHGRWIAHYPDRYGPDVLQLLRQGQAVSRQDYSQALLRQGMLRLAGEIADGVVINMLGEQFVPEVVSRPFTVATPTL